MGDPRLPTARLLRNVIEDMPDERFGLGRRHLQLTAQKDLPIVAGEAIVQGSCQLFARPSWSNEPRRDDDDQVSLFSLEGSAAQKRAQNGYFANPGQLALVFCAARLQKPSNREALPVPQFGGGLRSPYREPRDSIHRIGRVELAHFRSDFEIYDPVAQNRRRKCQAHAELFELNARRAQRTLHCEGELAARKEARSIT